MEPEAERLLQLLSGLLEKSPKLGRAVVEELASSGGGDDVTQLAARLAGVDEGWIAGGGAPSLELPSTRTVVGRTSNLPTSARLLTGQIERKAGARAAERAAQEVRHTAMLGGKLRGVMAGGGRLPPGIKGLLPASPAYKPWGMLGKMGKFGRVATYGGGAFAALAAIQALYGAVTDPEEQRVKRAGEWLGFADDRGYEDRVEEDQYSRLLESGVETTKQMAKGKVEQDLKVRQQLEESMADWRGVMAKQAVLERPSMAEVMAKMGIDPEGPR